MLLLFDHICQKWQQCYYTLGARSYCIPGIELADSLARKGSVTPFVVLEPAIGISKDCIKTTVFKILREQQYQEWLDSSGHRQAKEHNSGCSSKRAKELIGLRRNSQRNMVELLTGYCRFNGHLSIIKVVIDPLCMACKYEEETASHGLCSCEAYAAYRFESELTFD